MTKFLDKNFYNSLKTGPNFFLRHFKMKIVLNFVKFVATKKDMTTDFFHLSLLLLFLDPGSGMGKNQDPGSGINILDPQHWFKSDMYVEESVDGNGMGLRLIGGHLRSILPQNSKAFIKCVCVLCTLYSFPPAAEICARLAGNFRHN